MEYVDAGGLSGLSRFCFGCEQLGGVDWGDVDSGEISSAIKLSCDLGVNVFDTAAIYGLGASELNLSRSLGDNRDKVFIASKGGLSAAQTGSGERASVRKDSSPEAIRRHVTESIGRLQVDCIPVYFLHWPDKNTPVKDTMTELLALREEGKISRIGLSNFNKSEIVNAQRFGPVDFVQLPYSLLSRDAGPVVDYCADSGIGVLAYGVLAQGLLTGKYNSESRFGKRDRRHRLAQFSPDRIDENMQVVDRLVRLSMEMDRSPVQIAIRYVLQRAGVSTVVVGIKSKTQLLQCIDVFDWTLSASEVRFLECGNRD